MFTNKWMDANSGGGGGGDQGQQGNGQAQGAASTYETWLEKQEQPVKDLLDGHIKGLKTALTSERDLREGFEKQLREMAKKAEAGSDAQTKLTGMADQMAETTRKADFYEQAHLAGVTNLKLGFLVASNDKLFDKQGRVNFDEMKKNYSELFGSSTEAHGDAGSGTGGGTSGAGADMNKRIRAAAGRQ